MLLVMFWCRCCSSFCFCFQDKFSTIGSHWSCKIEWDYFGFFMFLAFFLNQLFFLFLFFFSVFFLVFQSFFLSFSVFFFLFSIFYRDSVWSIYFNFNRFRGLWVTCICKLTSDSELAFLLVLSSIFRENRAERQTNSQLWQITINIRKCYIKIT